MKYQKQSLGAFFSQIEFSLESYTPHGKKITDYDNIIICGLGGSGIAGRIVKSFFMRKCPVPIEVMSDYFLPEYAGERTLTLQCSYSGNTEETLAMYGDAQARGCDIISLSTGGKLKTITEKDGYPFYEAQPGFQPRMALGYGLTYLLLIFGELLEIDFTEELKEAAVKLKNIDPYINKAAEIFAHWKETLGDKTIIVTDYVTYPIGVRFMQQIQENSKAEAFVHELPEANHNVTESYYSKLPSHYIFLTSDANHRTTLRFNFLEGLLQRHGNEVQRIKVTEGNIQSLLDTIFLLDWISLWYSDAKGVESESVKNISELKAYLDKN